MQVNTSYAVGPSLIQDTFLNDAVEFIKTSAKPIYEALEKETRQNLQENPNHYSRFYLGLSGKSFDGCEGTQSLTIIPNLLSKEENEQPIYRFDYIIHIKKLDSDNPLACLIHKLSKRLFELNHPCNHADIRFEKGCCLGNIEKWHTDSYFANPYAITISFSNRKEWSTRIVEDFDMSDDQTRENLLYGKAPQPIVDDLEERSIPSILGFFYDASKVPHRSPIPSDMAYPPSPEDYRLFIRFTLQNRET